MTNMIVRPDQKYGTMAKLNYELQIGQMNEKILILAGAITLFLLTHEVRAQNVRYPDEFVIESVSFSPSALKAGEIVTATALVSLLEQRPENCQYVKCLGRMVWPTGGSVYLGDSTCEIRQLDPLNIEVTLKSKIAKDNPIGFYRFQGLSLKASCHDHASYYDGPRSRFKVIEPSDENSGRRN